MKISFKRNSTTVLMGLVAATLLLCAGQAKSQTSAPAGQAGANIMIKPGEAGGVVERTYTVNSKVTAIDKATRKITLTGDGGKEASFTAPPEMKNFDQLKVGDNVKATVTERMVIFVRSTGEDPSVSHAAAVAAAPKGAKPGAIAAQAYEIVASVKAIDTAKRTATLGYSDGSSDTYPVRADVDLSKYKVGDSVVIRVSDVLTVVATAG